MGNRANNGHFDNSFRNQYFSLLSQSFSHHKSIIKHYIPNVDLSYRKNFKNSNNNSNKKFRVYMHWKTYLINFFNKQAKKGHEFYLDIINDINKERFGFEEKYLSFMFYIDYENTFLLKNKENTFEKYINEEDFEHYEKELKNRLSRNSSINSNESINRRTKIELPNLPEEENNQLNSKYEKNKLKKQCFYLVNIIKNQIEEKEHPINIVISIFEKEISSLIDNILDSYKCSDLEPSDFNKKIEVLNNTIMHSIQKFTSKIHTAVKLFYSKVIHLDCFIEEKDELINIIMGILFNTGDLSKKIHNLLYLQFKEEYKDFAYKLKVIKNLKPKDIQIDDKFCLDENTDELIKQLKIKYKRNKPTNFNKSEDSGIFQILNEKEKKKKKNIKRDKYNSVIQIIKKIPKIKSPYKKMLLIASISTEITECIDNYWEDSEEFIPKSNYLQVNSDELLKIFIFIVVQSRVPDLIIQEMIVQNYTFNYTKSTMIGFYNSTLDAAINYIQKHLLDEVKIGITEEFRNSIIGSLKLNSNLKIDYNIDVEIDENTKLFDDIDIDEDYVLIDEIGNEIKRKEKEKEKEKLDSLNIANTFSEKNYKKGKYYMLDFFNGNK